MEWLLELSRALRDEQPAGPVVATLATVDRAGSPRARSVVCRRFADDGSAWVASDGRSGKNADVRGRAQAELVLWLPRGRVQFRLHGRVDVLAAGDGTDQRLGLWRELSDAARALFFWPAPGTPRSDRDEFRAAAGADEAPPASFEVLTLYPESVERLGLNLVPHDRRRWRRSDGWRAERLNP